MPSFIKAVRNMIERPQAVAPVSVPAAGLTVIASMKNDNGADWMTFHFDVAGQALDDFDVLGRGRNDAQLIDFTIDWTVDPPNGHRIREYTSTGVGENLAVTPAGGNGYFMMWVRGLEDIEIRASAGADSALVTSRPSFQ